jgi:hypothetical protein
MTKLTAVEQARAVMMEAADWGAFRWLLEKGRVQEIADRATAALAAADRRVKQAWGDDLKRAYTALVQQDKSSCDRKKKGLQDIPPELTRLARSVKEAYDEGQRARVQAEGTFDEAERQMSPDLARVGCQQALQSYDLRERAIRTAEAANSPHRDPKSPAIRAVATR